MATSFALGTWTWILFNETSFDYLKQKTSQFIPFVLYPQATARGRTI
jgi:hypothetical protein